ncbi:MAG: phosphoribosyltransferase family protein [Gemmatimonadales bacterium]
MSPRKRTVDATKGVLEIEWPFFGELSRGLALKVARAYDPELVIGIATAGVIPGAVIAAILGREFHSLVVSRKFHASQARENPEIFGSAPKEVRGKRVLIVDETCDSGDTLRLAISAVNEAGASEIKTAVSIRTGNYAPDFHAIATESTIILPWDREILVDGELRPNPLYADALRAAN